MRKLTILHSIDTGGPGGAESVFLKLARHFDAAGHRSIAVAKSGGWVERNLGASGVEYHVTETGGSLNVAYLRLLVGLVRDNEVDLIQSHLYGSNLYCALAGLLCRRPVVSAFHGQKDVQSPGRGAGLKRAIVDRGSSRIVAVSAGLRHGLVDAGFGDRDALVVIHNGTDTARFRPRLDDALRDELGFTPEDRIVGAVGNIRAPKAYDVFIDMAARLAADDAAYAFVIAGEGGNALESQLREQVARLGLTDRFRFLGFVDDTAPVYASLDVCVSSSDTEGFSLTCVEAMASGVPVVATRSGGPDGILEDGVTGMLVPARDPAALAAAVARLADEPDVRERLVSAARKHVDAEFSERRMCAAYEQLYAEVLGESPR